MGELVRTCGWKWQEQEIQQLAQCITIAEWAQPDPLFLRNRMTQHELSQILSAFDWILQNMDSGYLAKNDALAETLRTICIRCCDVLSPQAGQRDAGERRGGAVNREEGKDQRGVYNDFLRATLDNEDRARAMLKELDDIDPSEEKPSDKNIFQLAQCLAIADFPEGEQLPEILSTESQRHALRGTWCFLRDCFLDMQEQKVQGHDALITTIQTVMEKCRRVLN